MAENKPRVSYSFAPVVNQLHVPATAVSNEAKPVFNAETGPNPRCGESRVRLAARPTFAGANGFRCDFTSGFRIETPPGNGEYKVRCFDLDSGLVMQEFLMHGGTQATGSLKYYIRYRLEAYDAKSGKLLFEHDYDCAGREVTIVIPDGGLGDNLAWLPYVLEFQKIHRAKVRCVCGEWLIHLLGELYPELEFLPTASEPSAERSYAVYFCAVFNAERKSWRPVEHQHFGMQGSVAMILGVEPVPRKVRMPAPKPRTVAEPYVCISSMATNPCKYWNFPDGWNQLCRHLKNLGFRVLDIDRDFGLRFSDGKEYFIPSEAENFTGYLPLRERLEMIQNAAFFVGLPSGLSWLAWNCDVPVVMISGFTLPGSEFPTPYRVTNFHTCHGCWNDSGEFFDMQAPVWCPRHGGTPREIECTRSITPQMVIETVNRIPCVAEKLRSR